ncbi:polysaccharide biosynthesis tyrosine autokinase [bacterium]|nr:polysaccharide biosynthesis tyrosine autokinase [bacterium]
MDNFFEDPVESEESIDFSRYLKGIIRRWWLIGIAFLGITIPWVLYLKRQPPIYDTEVIIHFENIGGVPESLVQSRIARLQSRTFAEEVTATLGLAVELIQQEDQPFINRQDVFKIFSTTKEPVPGTYTLRFYPTNICALYFESDLLDSLQVERFIEDTVSYNGFSFSLNPNAVINHTDVTFRIHHFQSTSRSLQSRLSIWSNPPLNNQIGIYLADRDPVLLAQTVNMLAEILIEKSSEMRDENSRAFSNFLENQLRVVQQELDKYDSQLKAFRNEHLMGLDQETQDTINRLNAIHGDSTRLATFRNELIFCLGLMDFTSADFNMDIDAPYVYRQIAQNEVFDGDSDMELIRQQYEDERQFIRGLRWDRDLPETNPEVIESNARLLFLEDRIVSLAKNKLIELDRQITQIEDQMEELQKELDTFPEEDLKLIKLERQRRVNEDIYNLYLRQFTEAELSEAVISENAYVIDPALPPSAPRTGDKITKAFMGAVLGFLLGIVMAVIWEIADKRIRTHQDVKRYLKLPLLGVIPKVKFDDYELQDSEKAKSISSQIVTHDYSPTPVGEAYRSLRTNLIFSKNIGPIRSIAIGSVSPGEGKSFTAANLAITMAQQKSKTLLIDADLRRGVLHNSFNCPKKPGFTNYLTGVVSFDNVINETYIPNLSLITCGSLIPNPSELLGSIRMKRFIEGITKRYDFVIFDTPPLLAATDAIILGTLVDGVAVLIRAGKSHREDIKRKLELFQNVEAKVIGAILNCAGVEVAHEGYSYYRY